MHYLKEIEHASIWLRTKGVYKQAKLFVRNDVLFAGVSGGYIRLHAAGSTSLPTTAWLEIDPGPDNTLINSDLKAPSVEPIKKLKKAA